jgi:RNA polymerase sigma-70 factor (ECF subfamily)
MPDELYTKQLLTVQNRLLAYISVFVPNSHDAAEILQEANTVLIRKHEEFSGGDFWFWASKVAYFEVLTYRKRRNRNQMLNIDDQALQNVADEAATAMADVDDRIVALRKCMEKLPTNSRDLVRFRYGEGISSEDIARRVGQSALAVRQSLFRIREKLGACISQNLTPKEPR